MSCGKKRDIIDSMWSVFTSFGFYESDKREGKKYSIVRLLLDKILNKDSGRLSCF